MKHIIVTASHDDIKKLNAWKRDYQQTGLFKPFVTVRDVNRVGRRHWSRCPVQELETHELSDGEYRAYRKLMMSKHCIEVLEQYPLDIDETLDIAVAMNLIHPRDYKSNIAHVMTTDFLAKYRSATGENYRIAYTFKYFDVIYEEDELGNISRKNERTWQKFEIERQYWQRRKVGYQVLTERDATKAESWNYNYFERGLGTKATSSELEAFCLDFIESWLASPRAELQEHLQRISTTNNESFQRVQSLFQSACQRSLLPIDTTKYVRLFRPVGLTI